MTQHKVIVERLKAYSYKDAREIGRLLPFLSENCSGEPVPEALLREIIDSAHHEQLVARYKGEIVGTATLTLLLGPAVKKMGYLEDFVTNPSLRGHGIGGALWEEMMAWCRQNDVPLTFTSRPHRVDAHRFYKAHGAEVRDTTVFKVGPTAT